MYFCLGFIYRIRGNVCVTLRENREEKNPSFARKRRRRGKKPKAPKSSQAKLRPQCTTISSPSPVFLVSYSLRSPSIWVWPWPWPPALSRVSRWMLALVSRAFRLCSQIQYAHCFDFRTRAMALRCVCPRPRLPTRTFPSWSLSSSSLETALSPVEMK